MKTQPTITCLMPLKHYHPRFLTEAIESVLAQTSGAWKLLVITDGDSRTSRPALLHEFLAEPRITLAENQGRKLGGALNTGMRLATTEFVAVLLADDLWSRNAIATLSQAIIDYPAVDFFHSARFMIDGDGRRLSRVAASRPLLSLADFARSSPVKHLLCWRREKGLAAGGMDETLDHGTDDFDFPWTMAEAGASFFALEEPLYIYRDHREAFRLTTHIPLDTQKSAIRAIMTKHNAGEERIIERLTAAESSYLKQCLFRDRADRIEKERKNFDPRTGWRSPYRPPE